MEKAILFISAGLLVGLVSRANANPPAANRILWLKADAGVTVNGPSVNPPSADLVLWLKADAGVTTNASGVTDWADQAGGNNMPTAMSRRPAIPR